MLGILKSLNAHTLPIFQPILMMLVSKFMVHGALSDKTYLSLGLLSPLTSQFWRWDKLTHQLLLINIKNVQIPLPSPSMISEHILSN